MLLNKHPWIEKKDKINIRLLIEANLNETPKQSKPHSDFFFYKWMHFSLSGKDFDIVRFTTRCKTVCLPWRVFYRLARHSREIYALYSPRQCSELHNDDVSILQKN